MWCTWHQQVTKELGRGLRALKLSLHLMDPQFDTFLCQDQTPSWRSCIGKASNCNNKNNGFPVISVLAFLCNRFMVFRKIPLDTLQIISVFPLCCPFLSSFLVFFSLLWSQSSYFFWVWENNFLPKHYSSKPIYSIPFTSSIKPSSLFFFFTK